ncbi:hypothetical protein AAFF_G00262950 [Aldrovandia affinis]|uniref:Uncharacterized protein n=1 Tax=Aldrovandia affinis TaxID=143900 RepID=A0AAD7STU5_9TELE|nr:hypothetical protein AAFF_G00262950 [Aldrovandia affinis]
MASNLVALGYCGVLGSLRRPGLTLQDAVHPHPHPGPARRDGLSAPALRPSAVRGDAAPAQSVSCIWVARPASPARTVKDYSSGFSRNIACCALSPRQLLCSAKHKPCAALAPRAPGGNISTLFSFPFFPLAERDEKLHALAAGDGRAGAGEHVSGAGPMESPPVNGT